MPELSTFDLTKRQKQVYEALCNPQNYRVPTDPELCRLTDCKSPQVAHETKVKLKEEGFLDENYIPISKELRFVEKEADPSSEPPPVEPV